MWLLYCIDKSHALRCHSFSLVSDSFLPTTSPPGNTLKSDSAATPSLELLSVRSQFSKICSDILQLREGANEKSSEDCSTRAVTLSRALEEWYRSTKISQMMLSLDHHDVMRVKLQISYYYYEAQFQLLSTGLAYPSTSSLAKSQELRQLLNQSTREIITCSSTMSSEYLLQDFNHIFMNKLALCMLALDILLRPDENNGKKSRAFLSMVAGLFARIGILLPQSSVFEEVSDLIETLIYC
ncbi:AM-toxin biosynthesis protein 12 [Pyrenophora teres f. teres]|nr:AM-toxin biosynthesis protein 12 [Pyrenophora teres f. teres]